MIFSLLACNQGMVKRAPDSYRSTNVERNLLVFHYDSQGALAEAWCIQKTAVAGFTGKIERIEYKQGESISVRMANDLTQIFVIDNASGIRDSGGTALKFVDGLAYIKVGSPEVKNNATLEKLFRKTIAADPTNCDRNCKSGGCGASSCSYSSSLEQISTSVQVSCRAGYFACCSSNDVMISRCIASSCCK